MHSRPCETCADARFMALVLGVLMFVAMLILTAFARAQAATPVTPYTYARDYSWVAGKLSYSDLEGGFWTVTYQKPGGKPDRYGGHFVLILPDGMNRSALKTNGMVVVYGAPSPDSIGIQMAGTHYKVSKIVGLKASK
ncbi:MAG: hypothetical protein FJX76_11160 [Armatimonadetes bacterium]|nr:hypothetical protein [Armatimonadota bacterium]